MAKSRIKQGDQYAFPVTIEFNGEPLDLSEVGEVEFYFGDVRKTWPEDASYNEDEKTFYVPLTQEETFGFPEDDVIEADVRVKFIGDEGSEGVIGAEKKQYVTVNDAISEVVL